MSLAARAHATTRGPARGGSGLGFVPEGIDKHACLPNPFWGSGVAPVSVQASRAPARTGGMELNLLGPSGLEVSVLGLGCNNFGMRIDREASAAVVRAALDAGVTFFDTSDSYGGGHSEEYLGAALRDQRDDVVIATKFASPVGEGPYRRGASRKHLMAACETSLRRLGTDYIDLYYQHFPDPKTPIEETLAGLDDLVRSGKVRYIASSNFAGWQIADAEHVASARSQARFVASQSEWSLLARDVEREVVPACRAYGIGVVPFFPLASGLLTGKYRRDEAPPEGTRLSNAAFFKRVATERAFDTVERVAAVADSIGRSLLEVAIGWLVAHPVVPSVLVGATSAEQVRANAAAAEVRLTPDEVAAITEAARPRA
jgi:aryl-alcohol dehydrogenase-like predicted oxidoreductase